MKLTTDQIKTFNRDGIVAIPDLFSPGEIDRLAFALEEVKAKRPPGAVAQKSSDSLRLVYGAHLHHPLYAQLARHPRWVEPAKALLDSEVYIHQMRINTKAPFDGEGWWWHQDFATWHYEDGMPAPKALMIGILMDDCDACNGPLQIIPGSHRHGYIDQNAPDRDASGYTVMDLPRESITALVKDGGMRALTGKAGTVFFMHCNLVHGSGTNISPGERTIIYINVNAVDNAITNPVRADYFANRDFSPIQALADDCLN
ncbi:MAG: phytanoyl-CoA dioxygenase family protein [Burkholderiaceae bacterium]